LYLVACHC